MGSTNGVDSMLWVSVQCVRVEQHLTLSHSRSQIREHAGFGAMNRHNSETTKFSRFAAFFVVVSSLFLAHPFLK